ncbi:MAG TPA: molybdenum cofactor guanylyltransferase [Thermoanaerobaculia bacterium]|nr:molybdenum cofactor guanylyltransferase [Thermoanaerobaculia bacterium]
MPGVTGVVLAGGRSRRMGRDKAWIPVGGRPLVLHQADRLAEVFDDVVVAAKAEGPFAALGLRVVRDEEAEHAPIFGIRAALAGIGRPIFALAVDLPRFPPPLAAALARDLLDTGAPCVAPEAGGVVQGLCAAYSPEILPAIDRRIGEGRLSVRDLVAESGGAVRDGRFWGPFSGPEAFENWNRPDDPSVRHEA